MAASDICVSKNTGRRILLILYDLLMSGSLVCITDHIFRSLYYRDGFLDLVESCASGFNECVEGVACRNVKLND